jgi:hypothetical protein
MKHPMSLSKRFHHFPPWFVAAFLGTEMSVTLRAQTPTIKGEIASSKALTRTFELPLSGEIAFFAVKLVVFKGEKSEFRSIFIAIGRFFEDYHVLSLDAGRRTHNPLHLRLRHAIGDLVVIGQGQLRTS